MFLVIQAAEEVSARERKPRRPTKKHDGVSRSSKKKANKCRAAYSLRGVNEGMSPLTPLRLYAARHLLAFFLLLRDTPSCFLVGLLGFLSLADTSSAA